MKDLIKAIIAEVIPATVRTLDAATNALNEYAAQAQKTKPKGRKPKEQVEPPTEVATEAETQAPKDRPKSNPGELSEATLEDLRALMIEFSSTEDGGHDPGKRGQIVEYLAGMKLKKIDELGTSQRVQMYSEFLGRMGGV